MNRTKLHLDSTSSNQPEGTYPFGKNGIQNDLLGSVFNEPGFRKLQAVLPYKLNGVIETDGRPVIMSTDNINSAIGFFDPITEVYIPIIDDAVDWDYDLLGFDVNYYITGQAQRNYKGELVIAFTDKNGWPKYLNCDNPSISSVDDLRLFPYFYPPTITATQASGGRLAGGAYYIAVGYERNDGTSTSFSKVSSVIILNPGEFANTADKALDITITDVDQSYDFLRVAIISKINGITSVVELQDFVPITDTTVHLIFTGDDLTTDIDITEVLTPSVSYNKIGTIGQLNDYLYVAVLEQEPDLNDMQQYANMVQLEWKSELFDAISPPTEHINGTKRGWMHQEVVAAYIRYRQVRGALTKWFTVPGRALVVGDITTSSESTASGYVDTVQKYKVEDTIPYFDITTKTGGTGAWKNATEVYPDTEDFDSTAIGGENLRGTSVRHHRLPSLSWCKTNLYPTETDYGKIKLDILGLNAINVRIPDKYVGIIDGYEIGYAIRTVGNMTVYGQGLVMHTVTDKYHEDDDSEIALLHTSGGNWGTYTLDHGSSDFDTNFDFNKLRYDTFRFHAFDILLNKPSITPTYLSLQMKLRRDNLQSEGYYEDGNIDLGDNNGPIVHLVDYTLGTNIPALTGTGDKLRAISQNAYLTNTTGFDNFINNRHEATLAGKLINPVPDLNANSSGWRADFQSYTEAAVGSPKFEEAYLANLLALKENIYTNFYSQKIASAGNARALTDNSTFFGGDTYVSDYTFHTYGRHNSIDEWGDGINGIKTIRRFVCESVSNIHLRYEIAGNEYSKWYPRTAINPGIPGVVGNPDQCYITNFDRSQEPNQFGYTKDFNALSDLLDSTIFSPYREEINSFPFRIHRLGKISRQSRPRSWRTALPLDYYECQKNMGGIINVEGMDDTLLIHHENALFRTQDKAKLEAGLLSITLGTADIFQFEPQEAQSAKLGYAGTQHDLACVRTPAGYIFVDAKQGEIYLYKGQLANLNAGLNTFFRDALNITEKNVFTGNGITIGWDQKYKRILLTVKRKYAISDDTGARLSFKDFEDTADFWDNLTEGDVVLYKNRLVQYAGLNDTEDSCPEAEVVHTITWQKADIECVVDGDDNNTGYQKWNTRNRLTDGDLDGYSEPNSPTEGIGPYFPPEYNVDECPVADPTITWEGTDAFCVRTNEETIEADVTNTGYCLAHSGNSAYGEYFARVYNPGFSNDTIEEFSASIPGDVYDELTGWWINNDSDTVDGVCNAIAVWADSDCNGTPNSLSVGVQVTIPFAYNNTGAARTVFVGIMGDNEFVLKVNGVEIAATQSPAAGENFKILHLFPVPIRVNQNYFNVVGTGDGTVNDAVGMIIYDNTAAEIAAAASEAVLTVLFTSEDLIGTSIDIATCPPDYVLDNTDNVYSCKKIIDGGTNTGYKGYATICKYVNSIPTGECKDNDPDDDDYIAPVEDTVACPTEDIPPVDPEDVEVSGTVKVTCDDGGCTHQGNTHLKFTFDSPTPVTLNLLMGTVTNPFSGKKYVGSDGTDFYVPPVGAIADDYYDITARPDGHEIPFEISIPAGVTVFDIPGTIWQTGLEDELNASLICHNCLFPITDLYFKINLPTTGYVLNLTSATTGVTVNNI